jgi:hypothetical protein
MKSLRRNTDMVCRTNAGPKPQSTIIPISELAVVYFPVLVRRRSPSDSFLAALGLRCSLGERELLRSAGRPLL